MRVKATSPAKKMDLRERCGHLDLRSDCQAEQEFLSALYRVMVQGGTAYAKPSKDRKAVRVKWNRSD